MVPFFSEQLGYVGISLGTTIMFGLLASKPAFNDIIRPFIALAPCYRLYNMKSPYKYVSRLLNMIWRYNQSNLDRSGNVS